MGILEQLREKLGEGEISAGVEKKLKEYHHLITRESAQYLLALEIIGPVAELQEIGAAKLKSAPCMLQARLEKVYLPKIYQKGGSVSRTHRIEVSDQSGAATVACYDDAALAIESHALAGDLLLIGPVKYSSKEFHLQSGGEIKRMQKGARAKIRAKAGGNFEGKVGSFFGDFPYKKGQSKLSGEGESALMSAFELDDGSGKCRVVLWNSPGLAGALKRGMEVEIENGIWKNGEVHVNSAGRLVFAKGQKKMPSIDRIEIEEEGVVVFAKEKKIVMPSFEQACSMFGIVSVPEGIQLRTALELKKNEFIGKPLPEKWDEK